MQVRQVRQWRASPRPNAEVVEALERVLIAARSGHVQAVAVVVENPLHEVEWQFAGAVSAAWICPVVGGLSKLAHQLLNLI